MVVVYVVWQAFMRPERMKEMLEAVQAVLLQAAPDLRAIMKVLAYIRLVYVCMYVCKCIMYVWMIAYVGSMLVV